MLHHAVQFTLPGMNISINKITHLCQQSRIIWATTGSVSSGISRRRFWNPTAPTTCIGFNPFHGIRQVVNSHNITPKLYTSHLQERLTWWLLMPMCYLLTSIIPALTYFSLAGSFLKTSGAIHSGCSQDQFLVIYNSAG